MKAEDLKMVVKEKYAEIANQDKNSESVILLRQWLWLR